MPGIRGFLGNPSVFKEIDFLHPSESDRYGNESILNACCGNLHLAFFHPRDKSVTREDFIFTEREGQITLFISGMIYNLDELALKSRLQPGTATPPEILFNLWQKSGESIFNELNGDFVAGIYHLHDQRIILIRDHLGIHPLSYLTLDAGICFSSDTLDLCRRFQDNKPINCQYLLNQISVKHRWDYRALPNRRVNRLLPGHKLVFSGAELTVDKYWKPENIRINRKISREQVINDIRELVSDAARLRADHTVKAAVHLSGGLDSGIVSARVRQHYLHQSTFNGYSWSNGIPTNPEDNNSEINRLNATARHLNIHPVFQELTADEYLSYLSTWDFDLYILHELKVLAQAESNGDQLIFSGWGGDEFISINEQGVDSDLIFNLQFRHFLRRHPVKKWKRLAWVLLYQVLLPAISRTPKLLARDLETMSEYIRIDSCDPHSAETDLSRWRSRREVHLKLLYNYHIPARTEILHQFGRKHGITYRFPLLDKRIIEYMLSVPSKHLYRGPYTRVLLRELADEWLPEDFGWKDQKREPVQLAIDNRLRKEAALRIMEELKEIGRCSEMEVFDIAKMVSDFRALQNGETGPDPEILDLLVGLVKKRYEFVKGYSREYN